MLHTNLKPHFSDTAQIYRHEGDLPGSPILPTMGSPLLQVHHTRGLPYIDTCWSRPLPPERRCAKGSVYVDGASRHIDRPCYLAGVLRTRDVSTFLYGRLPDSQM